jgi:hypothetical protein
MEVIGRRIFAGQLRTSHVGSCRPVYGRTDHRFAPPHPLIGPAARFHISPREPQVLALLLDGAKLEEIGRKRNIHLVNHSGSHQEHGGQDREPEPHRADRTRAGVGEHGRGAAALIAIQGGSLPPTIGFFSIPPSAASRYTKGRDHFTKPSRDAGVRASTRGTTLYMNKKHQKTKHLDADAATSGLREAITSADATGLIASEELITEAETMLPISPQRAQ